MGISVEVAFFFFVITWSSTVCAISTFTFFLHFASWNLFFVSMAHSIISLWALSIMAFKFPCFFFFFFFFVLKNIC